MVNYRINEAETIFQAFYDSGESYPNHEKYSVLSEYTVTYTDGTVGKTFVNWCAVNISIESQKTSDYAVKMERECSLDIAGYDVLRLFAMIDLAMDIRIQCVIDGKKVTVLESPGLGDTGEMDGAISGKTITSISLEFRNRGSVPAVASLAWMGLSNTAKQEELESRKSPYDGSWEGCFVDGSVELKPMIGIYFDEKELDVLRDRLSKEPFLSMANQLREQAKKCMEVEPEPYITEYLPRHDRRWARKADLKRPLFQENMHVLAFIGLLDLDADMLRMACRKLLSVAVTPKWTESIMGCLPGATWHHRSFTEDETCTLCALVLDWAGNLLTWHGKNIVYDALMLKGLPRLEADFHSVDYIREMNQGIVFNSGRILALLALAHRYPRYEARLQDAAKDEREMIDRYILEDGGTPEGPSYWNYTFRHVLSSVSLLARHAGVSLEEYAWDRLKKTGEYGLSMLSDCKDGTCFLPVNDAHSSGYSPVVYSGFGRISQDPRWKMLYSAMMQGDGVNQKAALETVLLSADVECVEGELHRDGFVTFNETGHTSLRRTTADVGRVHCCLAGGASIFAHCHSDKGQILLEVDGIPMLIDRGICTYSHPAINVLGQACNHNLFCPEAPEGERMYDQDRFHGIGGKVLKASFKDEVLEYCTDTTLAWEAGIFESITRSVRSEDPHIYLIYDDAVMVRETVGSFRLHTRGSVSQLTERAWAIVDGGYQITVTPVNYEVTRAVFGEDGVDEHIQPVNSLKLYLDEAKEQHIVTLLEVSRVGENRARVLSEREIAYGEQKIQV